MFVNKVFVGNEFDEKMVKELREKKKGKSWLKNIILIFWDFLFNVAKY